MKLFRLFPVFWNFFLYFYGYIPMGNSKKWTCWAKMSFVGEALLDVAKFLSSILYPLCSHQQCVRLFVSAQTCQEFVVRILRGKKRYLIVVYSSLIINKVKQFFICLKFNSFKVQFFLRNISSCILSSFLLSAWVFLWWVKIYYILKF